MKIHTHISATLILVAFLTLPLACMRSGFVEFSGAAGDDIFADAGPVDAAHADLGLDANAQDSENSDVFHSDSGSPPRDAGGADTASFSGNMFLHIASASGSIGHLTTLAFTPGDSSSLVAVGPPLDLSIGSIFTNASYLGQFFYFAGANLTSLAMDSATHQGQVVGSDGAYIQTWHMRAVINSWDEALYLTGDGPGGANLMQYDLDFMSGLASPMASPSASSLGTNSGLAIDTFGETVIEASYASNEIAMHLVNSDGSLSDIVTRVASCTAPREVYFCDLDQVVNVICDGPPAILYKHLVDVDNHTISAYSTSINLPGGTQISAVIKAPNADDIYVAKDDGTLNHKVITLNGLISSNWPLLPGPATSLGISEQGEYLFVGLAQPPRVQVYRFAANGTDLPELLTTYNGLSEDPVSIVVMSD